MKRRRQGARRRRLLRDIVVQRVELIMDYAGSVARSGDLSYASRLGLYARSLSLATGVRPPRRLKRSACKNCGIPLIPGVTSRTRLRSQGRFSYRAVTCLNCGWILRYPYKPRRSDSPTKP